MKVHKGFTGLTIKNAVVTTGSFDGVHVGHKAIINRLNTRAQELGGESVLISFFPHPRKVLFPDTYGKDLKMILSQEEKINRLGMLGLDHLIIVEFTLDFAQTTSVDFIRKYLVSQLGVKHVIIGFNHHFGHNREGDLEYLEELGKYYHFSVEEIPEQDIHNESVSSTKIRKAITEGNIQRANAYLDHPFVLSGRVGLTSENHLDGVMNVTGIEEDKLLPPPGAYAISCTHYQTRFKACLWILQAEETEPAKILIYPDQFNGFRNMDYATFEFHKCISSLNGKDSFSEKSMKTDIEKVLELIY